MIAKRSLRNSKAVSGRMTSSSRSGQETSGNSRTSSQEKARSHRYLRRKKQKHAEDTGKRASRTAHHFQSRRNGSLLCPGNGHDFAYEGARVRREKQAERVYFWRRKQHSFFR